MPRQSSYNKELVKASQKYAQGMKKSVSPSVVQIHQMIDRKKSTVLQLPKKSKGPFSTNFILNLEPTFQSTVWDQASQVTVRELPKQIAPTKKKPISKKQAKEQPKKIQPKLDQDGKEKPPEEVIPSDHEIAQSMKLLRELKDQVDELQDVFIKLMEKYPSLRIDILLALNESRKLKNLNLLRGLKRRDALTNSPATSSSSESWGMHLKFSCNKLVCS